MKQQAMAAQYQRAYNQIDVNVTIGQKKKLKLFSAVQPIFIGPFPHYSVERIDSREYDTAEAKSCGNKPRSELCTRSSRTTIHEGSKVGCRRERAGGGGSNTLSAGSGRLGSEGAAKSSQEQSTSSAPKSKLREPRPAGTPEPDIAARQGLGETGVASLEGKEREGRGGGKRGLG